MRRFMRCLIISFLSAILLFTMAACEDTADASDTFHNITHLGDRDESASKVMGRKIYKVAREIVRKKLSTPSTAKFPPYDESLVEASDGYNYVVTAYVDSKYLGETIRSDFIIEIHIEKDGDTYNYTINELQPEE